MAFDARLSPISRCQTSMVGKTGHGNGKWPRRQAFVAPVAAMLFESKIDGR
jgi:hypothetical protein